MSKTYTDCPFCGEKILSTAIKCKHCNSFISGYIDNLNAISTDTQIQYALAEKFQVLELIGKGGMANVYKAVQKNLQRIVALKIIHQNLIHDSEFIDRFHREARISASLNHRNIIMIHDDGILNGIHFMSMEYLDGSDLHHLIKERGRLTSDETRRIIAPIAEALDYANKKGLIHRDVKSANIFITKEGRPVLTDFGIARVISGTKLTQDGSIIGTPEYMSPEQATGDRTDGRSDIFSLGVVMYECLTGKVPFKGENPLITIHSLVYNNPPPVGQVNINSPKWLSSLVMSALEKSPAKRIQSGEELSKCLTEGKAYTVKRNPWKEINYKNQNFYSSKFLITSYLMLILVIFSFIIFLFLKNDREENLITTSTPLVSTTRINVYSTDSVSEEFSKLKKLGEEKLQKKDMTQARIEFNKALALKPGDKYIINQLETIQKKLSQKAKTEIQKQFSEIIQNADVAFQSESYSEALRFYQLANKLISDDAYVKSQISEIKKKLQNLNTELNRIEIIEGSGNSSEALKEYTQLLTNYPGNQTIQERIENLNQTLKTSLIQQLNTQMIRLPKGKFKMGSDQADDDQRPMHDVTVNSFQMDMYEVTVKQYRIYCEVKNLNMPKPPAWGWNDNHPIVNITWKEAADYAAYIGKRLPTEAEWEYAASGGSSKSRYSGENSAQKVAWYKENSRCPQPVGLKNSNNYGLKDMSGNVWEWCNDFYDNNYYKLLESDNPSGPPNGNAYVIRGGAFNSSTAEIQVKYRFYSIGPADNIGFRCASN